MRELLVGFLLSMCVCIEGCYQNCAPTESRNVIMGNDTVSISIVNNVNLLIQVQNDSLTLSLRSNPETFRGMMDGMKQLLPTSNSPMLSYVLVPALTLAGLVPWIVPGIRIAAGFAQLINQVAFSAGLSALVRSYVFDARPDQHIVYVNHGYGVKGHTKHNYYDT